MVFGKNFPPGVHVHPYTTATRESKHFHKNTLQSIYFDSLLRILSDDRLLSEDGLVCLCCIFFLRVNRQNSCSDSNSSTVSGMGGWSIVRSSLCRFVSGGEWQSIWNGIPNSRSVVETVSDASSENVSDNEWLSQVELSIFRYGVWVLTGRFSLMGTVGLTGRKYARCTDVANATDRLLEVDWHQYSVYTAKSIEKLFEQLCWYIDWWTTKLPF